MKAVKYLSLVAVLAAGVVAMYAVGTSSEAEASVQRYRQYYSSYRYYPRYNYYYRYYYYKPRPAYSGYRYHYCITYPSQPRYTYYYNPHSSQYWGRYDFEEKGYSLLAEKDRKSKLDDIPESAFPKPADMPPVPDSEDGATIDVPPNDPPGPPPADIPGEGEGEAPAN